MRNSEARPGSNSARGFWLRLVVFCAPLALGWVALEKGMAKVPTSNAFKRDHLRALAGEVDTLILGSSEAYYGIKPSLLSGSAFSLSNSSQSLYYDDLLTQRLLPELPQLRRVIIPISYFTLYFQLYDHDESWRQYAYRQEWGLPLAHAEDERDVRAWSRVVLYTPKVAITAALERFHTTLAPGVDDRGWYHVPEGESWGVGPAAAKASLARHHGFMKLEHEAANLASLEHLLANLRQHEIEAVLITTPVWPTYQAGMKPELWERAKADVARLSQQYGARYLSFLHTRELTPDDFLDPDHLNARGAEHFTPILDAALRSSGAEARQVETRGSSIP
jgi:hypothetical protein